MRKTPFTFAAPLSFAAAPVAAQMRRRSSRPT